MWIFLENCEFDLYHVFVKWLGEFSKKNCEVELYHVLVN